MGSSSGSDFAMMEVDLDMKEFPVGMKVLVVDDDATCLKILERMLQKCRYDVTTCSEATSALNILRESRGSFDVVISDVHMPDVDGFMLLELIGLEMNLPVIMMSADSRTEIVMKGVKHGACDYIIKPVRLTELQNIWQHVMRKRWRDNRELEHSGSLEDPDNNRRVINEADYTSSVNDGSDGKSKSQKKRRDAKEEDDGELENEDPSSSKKHRVVWTRDLHEKFVNAVNRIGIDKAVPKRILELMDVSYITRENVASHLQKYRLYLRKLNSAAVLHAGLSGSLSGPVSNAKVGRLGRFGFHAVAKSGRVPPQTLPVFDELQGRPSNGVIIPSMEQQSFQQVSFQRSKAVSLEKEFTFGQSMFKSQGNAYQQFPSWSCDKNTMVDSTNAGGLSNSKNGIVLSQSDSHHSLNVNPSSLVAPSQSLRTFHPSENPMFINRNASEVSPHSSLHAVISQTPDAIPLQSSIGFQAGNSSNFMSQASIAASAKMLASFNGNNSSGHVYQNNNVVISQTANSFQRQGNLFLINSNSTLVCSQASTDFQADNNHVPVNYNSGYNSASTIVDSNLVFSMNQGFSELAMPNSYLLHGPVPSPVSSCINDSLVHVVEEHACLADELHPLVPNSCNDEESDSLVEKLPSQGLARNLGFVGKGTCISSRFIVDDNKSPNNILSHSNGCNSNVGDKVNADIYGFSGQR